MDRQPDYLVVKGRTNCLNIFFNPKEFAAIAVLAQAMAAIRELAKAA